MYNCAEMESREEPEIRVTSCVTSGICLNTHPIFQKPVSSLNIYLYMGLCVLWNFKNDEIRLMIQNLPKYYDSSFKNLLRYFVSKEKSLCLIQLVIVLLIFTLDLALQNRQKIDISRTFNVRIPDGVSDRLILAASSPWIRRRQQLSMPLLLPS